MLLEPVDPNERFRDRRRQARQSRARRRIAALTVVALSAAVIALGASFLNGRGQQATMQQEPAQGTSAAPAVTQTAPAQREPVPLPDEIRGVHVTMALASLDGKLDEYFALTSAGLNTLQLDVKDENGEVGFQRGVGLAKTIGAALRYYDPAKAAREAEAKDVYLIGRVVVFEDPKLSVAKPGMAIRRSDGSVWTNHAGLGWTNPYDKRVWKYNVDIAAAAAKAGFDEIMFDYVRFPTDGDLASAVFKGRRPEHKSVTIASFLEYAKGRLKPLGVRVSAAIFGLTATRDMGIGQRPRRLARHVDAVYPMVYPSHYGAGEYNLADPNAVPGITVARSLRDFRRALRGLDTELVPWLQDFSLGRDYTLTDVQAQILAARDANSRGFLLWNPSGVYTREALAGS
jgi:hypothetical protein